MTKSSDARCLKRAAPTRNFSISNLRRPPPHNVIMAEVLARLRTVPLLVGWLRPKEVI